MKKRKFGFVSMLVMIVCLVTACYSGEKELINDNTASPDITATSTKGPEKTPAPTMDSMVRRKEEIINGLKQQSRYCYEFEGPFLDWIQESQGADILEIIHKKVKDNTYSDSDWLVATGNSLPVLWDTYSGILQSKEMAKEHNIYFLDTKKEDEITLRFVGDFNFADNWHMAPFADHQKNGIEDCFSSDLLKLMREADLMMGNNEFPYSDRGKALKGKAYTFRAATSRVALLDKLGMDIVSMANNHAYDFGEEALLDTLHTLEKAKVPYVGAGKNLEEAMKPVYYIANGIKIGIVSATQIERHYNYTKEATNNSAGVLRTRDDKFIRVIETARKNCDYLIAYVHWGTEYSHQIDSQQKSFRKEIITAGADLIIGAHPHILQGVEYYKGKPIIYSLGNFWFNGKTLDTALLEVTLKKDELEKIKLIPAIQHKKKTKIVSGKEKQRILHLVQSVSFSNVSVSEDGIITEDKKQ